MLQRILRDAETQNRADGRFRRAQALPAIRRVACATERDQRSQPSQRTGGTRLVQRPAMDAGPARATGAIGGERSTPGLAPPLGKDPSGFVLKRRAAASPGCGPAPEAPSP